MTSLAQLLNKSSSPTYPFRNRVRNGAMQVDQRGTASAAIVAGTSVTAGSFVIGTRYIITAVGTTSFTGIGASANTVGVSFIASGVGSGTGTARVAPYTLDGWCVNAIGGGIVSTQQVTDAPTGFSKSLKCTITTADASLGTSNYYNIQQMIEGQDLIGASFGTASAQSIALSFWVKSSVAATYAVALQNGAQNRTYPVTFTVAATGTWQLVKLIIPGDSTGTWATDATNGLSLIFTLGAGTNFNGTSAVWAGTNTPSVSTVTSTLMSTVNSTFQISGVQLEVSASVTPFEYYTVQGETARNQRYMYQNAAPAWRGFMSSGTAASRVGGLHPVPMRTAPVVYLSGTINVYSGALSASNTLVTNFSTAVTAEADFTTGTGSAGAPAVIYQGGAGYINVTAELAS